VVTLAFYFSFAVQSGMPRLACPEFILSLIAKRLASNAVAGWRPADA
jgi:hypothetical protein